jgi:hypothetical protein
MKKALLSSSLLLLLGGACVFSFANVKAEASQDKFEIGKKLVVNELNLSENTYVFDKKLKDINGDNIKDTVVLTGVKIDPKDSYAFDMSIIIEDGKTKKFCKKDWTFKGTDGKVHGNVGRMPKLFIGDFTGDEIKDVMVTAPQGGNGGFVNHMIMTFNENKPAIIFSNKENEGIKFTGKFIDNFKVEVKNESLDKTYSIDVTKNKEDYIKNGLYNKDGKLLKEENVHVSEYFSLAPIDKNMDGTFELLGRQAILPENGYLGSDIGYFDTIESYKDGKWTADDLMYSIRLK